MSNNSNNRPQPQTANQPVSARDPDAVPKAEVGDYSPIKTAVVLCLNLLLRAAVYGHVPRSADHEIKEALETLK